MSAKTGFRPTRPFGPQVPDMTSAVWLKRRVNGALEQIVEDEGPEESKKRKASKPSSTRNLSDVLMPTGSPLPRWAAEVEASDSFESQTLFCQCCGGFLDLRQSGTDVKCSSCGFITQCTNGSLLMRAHAVVRFPAHKHWMEKLDRAKHKSKVGAQRAEVTEECPKCKFPKMFFWTQQLRSADEGQTVFYECGNCSHRFSINT